MFPGRLVASLLAEKSSVELDWTSDAAKEHLQKVMKNTFGSHVAGKVRQLLDYLVSLRSICLLW